MSRKTHELDFADCLAQAGSEMFQNRRQFPNRSFLIQFEKVRNRQDDEHSPAINHQQPLLARMGPVSTQRMFQQKCQGLVVALERGSHPGVVKSAAGLFYALAHIQELQVSCAYHGRQTDEVDFPPQDTLAGSLKVKEAKCEREEQNDCG